MFRFYSSLSFIPNDGETGDRVFCSDRRRRGDGFGPMFRPRGKPVHIQGDYNPYKYTTTAVPDNPNTSRGGGKKQILGRKTRAFVSLPKKKKNNN